MIAPSADAERYKQLFDKATATLDIRALPDEDIGKFREELAYEWITGARSAMLRGGE